MQALLLNVRHRLANRKQHCKWVLWAAGHMGQHFNTAPLLELAQPLPAMARAMQVADGHHQHYVSELVCAELQPALVASVLEHPDLEQALVRSGSGRCMRVAQLPAGFACRHPLPGQPAYA